MHVLGTSSAVLAYKPVIHSLIAAVDSCHRAAQCSSHDNKTRQNNSPPCMPVFTWLCCLLPFLQCCPACCAWSPPSSQPSCRRQWQTACVHWPHKTGPSRGCAQQVSIMLHCAVAIVFFLRLFTRVRPDLRLLLGVTSNSCCSEQMLAAFLQHRRVIAHSNSCSPADVALCSGLQEASSVRMRAACFTSGM